MLRHLMRKLKDSLMHGKSRHYGPYNRYSSSAGKHYGYGHPPPYKRYSSSDRKRSGYGHPPHYGHNQYGSPYYKKKRSSFFSS